MKALGIILVGIGALGLAYGGFSFYHRETLIDIGPIHATHEKEESFPISPVVGGLTVAAGVVLLLVRKKGE